MCGSVFFERPGRKRRSEERARCLHVHYEFQVVCSSRKALCVLGEAGGGEENGRRWASASSLPQARPATFRDVEYCLSWLS